MLLANLERSCGQGVKSILIPGCPQTICLPIDVCIVGGEIFFMVLDLMGNNNSYHAPTKVSAAKPNKSADYRIVLA